MRQLIERLGIQDWTKTERAHGLAMLVILVGAVVHHCVLFHWYIEDAAISFAYSKHLAMGEGLVPFIGGERVEGYSNPAWVFFLAPFSWLFDLIGFVKYLQVALVIPTVLFTWFAAREVLGRDSHLALVAPATLAISAQAALWSGAGLEIGLMNLLMAAALWRSLVELRTRRWPWSALLWLGVTLCRPEAILYAAVAGFCAMVFSLEARRGVGPTLQWLATFFVPFGLYQGWRYQYFAWELPNTYYAKLERRPEFPLLDWAGKSWNYTRDFASELGWGFFLPVWVLGVVGHRGWRLPVALGACTVAAMSVELAGTQRFLVPTVMGFLLFVFWIGLRRSEASPPAWLARAGLAVAAGLVGLAELLRWQLEVAPGPIPTFDWMASAPPYVLIGVGLLLPLLSYRSEGWQGRTLTWMLCGAAIFFALIAQWDWMKGFRWYAPAVVPGAVLFALGVYSMSQVVQDLLSERGKPIASIGWVTAAVLVAATIAPNVSHTVEVARAPDTQPNHIKSRVRYVNSVRDRLHVEERFVDLDVDQGGHLYWSDFEMMDVAGLIEIPLSHHKFEREFVKQYLFEERRPHFIHIHGGWASSSRIPHIPEFRRNYVEIPGYVANAREFHIGNHVRRDLVLAQEWPHPGEPVAIEGGVVLHGAHVPSAPAQGGWMYVEVGMSHTRPVKKKERDDFRAVLFATSRTGALHTWEVAPGYDWIWPHEWEGREIFVAKLDLRLPDTLEPGTYDLGLVVFGADGAIRGPAAPVTDLPEDTPIAPVYARGEVIYRGALEVLTVERNHARSSELAEAARTAADEDRCEEAVQGWFHARKHRPRDSAWEADNEPSVVRRMANCFARRADTATSREERVNTMERARELDHWAPDYRKRRSGVARELYEAGLAARTTATTTTDWELVFHWFNDAVRVDRRWSWARRYAEEARALWLEIDDASLAEREAEKERVREENRLAREAARERREALKAEREAKKALADQEDEGSAP